MTPDQKLLDVVAQALARGSSEVTVPRGLGAAANRVASTGAVWLHQGVITIPPCFRQELTVYKPYRPRREAQALITIAASIIDEYVEQRYDLTLRQLYYQFVARDHIPNTQESYNNLGFVISKARLGGYLPWGSIVDRTRSLKSLAHWGNPSEILTSCAEQYRRDLWETQPTRVEVWVEKEALAGVVARTCRDLDVPYFSCRGYVSQSAMWQAGQRLMEYSDAGQRCVILHLGDHDPSGIDMSRDIVDRLAMFTEKHVGSTLDIDDALESETQWLVRIALNRDQVDRYEPPPNPAKLTDSRAADYIAEHGEQSWELDALEPRALDRLIRESVSALRDDDAWELALKRQEREQDHLWDIAGTRSGLW